MIGTSTVMRLAFLLPLLVACEDCVGDCANEVEFSTSLLQSNYEIRSSDKVVGTDSPSPLVAKAKGKKTKKQMEKKGDDDEKERDNEEEMAMMKIVEDVGQEVACKGLNEKETDQLVRDIVGKERAEEDVDEREVVQILERLANNMEEIRANKKCDDADQLKDQAKKSAEKDANKGQKKAQKDEAKAKIDLAAASAQKAVATAPKSGDEAKKAEKEEAKAKELQEENKRSDNSANQQPPTDQENAQEND